MGNDANKKKLEEILDRIIKNNPEKFNDILEKTNKNNNDEFFKHFEKAIEDYITKNHNKTENIKLKKFFSDVVKDDKTRKIIKKKIIENYFL